MNRSRKFQDELTGPSRVQKNNVGNLLPKTPFEISNGGVYRQLIRCGKKACKCARGDMHEAHYFMSRCYGRQTKIYVPKSKVHSMNELVAEARYLRRRTQQALLNADKEIKRLRDELREIKNLGELIEFVKYTPDLRSKI